MFVFFYKTKEAKNNIFNLLLTSPKVLKQTKKT